MTYLPETNYLIASFDISSDSWMHKIAGQKLSQTAIDLNKLEQTVPKDATDAADFIADQIPSCLSFNAESGKWYVWNGKVHTPLTVNTVPMQLIDILGYAFKNLDALLNEYIRTGVERIKAANKSDDETAKDIANFKAPITMVRKEWQSVALSLHSNKGVKDVLDKLSRRVSKSNAYFEDDRRWLVVRNGVIDIPEYRATGAVELLAHSASRPVYRYFDADYYPAAAAETWRRFLTSSIIDSETVKLLQKAVGAAFSAEEKPRALFNLLGAPASGKSVFLSVFNRLGQAYSVMPNNQAIQLNNGDTNFYQDALRGARFVGFSEVQGKKQLDDGFLKGVLGADQQETRQMRQTPNVWKPQCVLFIASNMALKFDTRDEATFIKILPIPFPHSFTETDAEHQMDRELEAKVLEERSGVLSWVLEGMGMFWTEGLAPTAAVIAAMDGNKTANSPSLQFMGDLIESGLIERDNMAPVSACLAIGTAYDMFRHWADAQGIKSIPGKQTFTSDVADFYYGKKRSGSWMFVGLKNSPKLQADVHNGISLAHTARNL
jgi:P4 family phage/plasmid primase-like protien